MLINLRFNLYSCASQEMVHQGNHLVVEILQLAAIKSVEEDTMRWLKEIQLKLKLMKHDKTISVCIDVKHAVQSQKLCGEVTAEKPNILLRSWCRPN